MIRSKTKAWPVFLLAGLLFGAGLARDRLDAWIEATIIPPPPATSVEVLDRNASLLRAYTVENGRWRLALRPDGVDPDYLRLLLGYEDKRFYDHAGVDPLALLRAAGQTIRRGKIVSGGSTLTMQVARLLEASGTGKMTGKLRQIRLALALERRFSKDEILQLYLHLAPFGGNIEGIRAASFAYYGKEPRRLTKAEAALLVALPQAPESRRPDRHHARALAARDRVLARAEADGLLAPDEAQAARSERVPHLRRPVPQLAPHLADRARAAEPLRPSHRLTIDALLQRSLEGLARDLARNIGGRNQVAIVVADHRNGEILASVGSADFTDHRRAGFIDMTQALRSPGSTLKPLVYALAFDQGLAHPETLLDDRPQRFGSYAPQNFDRRFHGTLRLREALQQSLNLPVVEVLDAMGPAKLMTALDKSGAKTALPGGVAGLAVALGGIGISLQDLVQLYAALARGGVAQPLSYRWGDELPEGQRLVSKVAAWQIGDILAGLAPPPGSPPNRLAYKTGTSYGHRDAWAIGYDGAHVIGIWMGRPDGTPTPGAFGADLAAPALFEAFARLKPQLAAQPPAPPATLLVANGALPPPLQKFRRRDDAFSIDPQSPRLAFPPDGAEVELLPEGLMVKVEAGKPPFTWLADGAPLLIGEGQRQSLLPLQGAGFVTLSVIDAEGRAARARLRLR